MRYGGVGIRSIITMTLGDMVESIAYGIRGTVNDKIRYARPHIFNFEYDAWTDEHKERFETLFIKHFYANEIGFETEGRFIMELETWCQLNMPYWNKLLKSQLFEEQIKNPFHNYELTDTTTIETDKQANENVKNEEERKANEQQQGNLKNDKTGEVERDQTNSGNENSTTNIVTGENNQVDETTTETINIDSENSKTAKETLVATETTTNEHETDNTLNETNNNTTNNSGTQNNTKTQSNFNRDLTDGSPQNRLGITANDGTGMVNYASEIKENKGTANETDNQTTTNTGTDNTIKTGTANEKLVGSSSKNNNNETNVTDKEILKQDETNESSTQTTEIKSGSNNETENKTTTDILNEKQKSVENEQQTTTTTTANEEKTKGERLAELKEQSNSKEQRHAIGSIGVSRYDELLNGYRTIFKNYDKQILDAMHTDLFMLVY